MEKVFLLCHPEREVVPGRRGRVPKPESVRGISPEVEGMLRSRL